MINQNEKSDKVQVVDDSKAFFTMIPNILDTKGLTPTAFRLYFHLKCVTGEKVNGRCWQSTRTMATACNLDKNTITKAKGELLDAGLIEIQKETVNGRVRHVIRLVDLWAENAEYHAQKDQETASENLGQTESASEEIGQAASEKIGQTPLPASENLGHNKNQLKIKQKEKDNNNKSPHEELNPPAKPPPDDPDFVVVLGHLIRFGIADKKARSLVESYGQDFVLEKVRLFETMITTGQVYSPGWLIRAIEEDYQPPNERVGSMIDRLSRRLGKHGILAHEPHRYIRGKFAEFVSH